MNHLFSQKLVKNVRHRSQKSKKTPADVSFSFTTSYSVWIHERQIKSLRCRHTLEPAFPMMHLDSVSLSLNMVGLDQSVSFG